MVLTCINKVLLAQESGHPLRAVHYESVTINTINLTLRVIGDLLND